MCDALRSAQHSRHVAKLARCFVESPEHETRIPLAALAGTNQSQAFVATVGGRGFKGKQRTVLVTDLHPFGLKFLFADHLWVPYDKKWERIEPFVQGLKVVLLGTAVEYSRKDGTCDYTLALTRVTKLWLMDGSKRSELGRAGGQVPGNLFHTGPKSAAAPKPHCPEEWKGR